MDEDDNYIDPTAIWSRYGVESDRSHRVQLRPYFEDQSTFIEDPDVEDDFEEPFPSSDEDETEELPIHTESVVELTRLCYSLNDQLKQLCFTLQEILPSYSSHLTKLAAERAMISAENGSKRIDVWSTSNDEPHDVDACDEYFQMPTMYFSFPDESCGYPNFPHQGNTFASTLMDQMRGWQVTQQRTLIECIRSEALDEECNRAELNAQFPRLLEISDQAFDKELSKIRERVARAVELPLVDLVGPRTRQFDWMKIVNSEQFQVIHERLIQSYRPEAAELMWRNALHPSINRSRWTFKEDLLLRKLVTEMGLYSWDEVAKVEYMILNELHDVPRPQKMETRSAYSCACRFHTCHNASIRENVFTPSEDQQLVSAVRQWQSPRNGLINWERVKDSFDTAYTSVDIKSRFFELNSPQFDSSPCDEKTLASLMAFFTLFPLSYENWAEVTRLRHPKKMRTEFSMFLGEYRKRRVGSQKKPWRKSYDVELLNHVIKSGEALKGCLLRANCPRQVMAERLELLKKVIIDEGGTLDDERLQGSYYNTREVADRDGRLSKAFSMMTECLRQAWGDWGQAEKQSELQTDPYEPSVKYKIYKHCLELLGVPNKPRLGSTCVVFNRSNHCPLEDRSISQLPKTFINDRILEGVGSQLWTRAVSILALYNDLSTRRRKFEFDRVTARHRTCFMKRSHAEDFSQLVSIATCLLRVDGVACPSALGDLVRRVTAENFWEYAGTDVTPWNVHTDRGIAFAPVKVKTNVVLLSRLKKEMLGKMSDFVFSKLFGARILDTDIFDKIEYPFFPPCMATMTGYEIMMMSFQLKKLSRQMTSLVSFKRKYADLLPFAEKMGACRPRNAKCLEMRPRNRNARQEKENVASEEDTTETLSPVPRIIRSDDPVFVRKPVATYSRKRKAPEADSEAVVAKLASISDERPSADRNVSGLGDASFRVPDVGTLSPDDAGRWLEGVVTALFAAPCKPRGLRTARKHVDHRRVQVWADKDHKKSNLGTRWKANPFQGASHAKGIVLEKV
ncbi:unnamed protein product [Notodromas monacha]|uniref:Myb-like domain-containing protein n=1 Tax=Notodromas monacha TaxID=399045 RepID=A0A7R9BVN6_9CRUS|nr:unnamed protein product [Notodromas monacha]CAG0922629.1 unnamed protein product [Notodromas monacha]